MKGIKQSYVIIALVAVGVALFFSGIAGGAVFLLWPLACMGLMVAMMWGMRGMGQPAQHTHADGVTHAHDEEPRVGSRR